MSNAILSGQELPFCKGCGHHLISQNTEKALQKLGYKPLDVILVSDIGCHGVVDKNFLTHTVHGLHGRSVALAAGISAGLSDPSKKIIVFIGDGGASIGIQHIVEAAHKNFNMTVIVHNNFLYGMTGGQSSKLTPSGFCTRDYPQGKPDKGYDICKLVDGLGAAYVSRIKGIGDFSDALAEAFAVKGFSLVEVMEICPSYGLKSNPGMKLSEVMENAGLNAGVVGRREVEPVHITPRTQLPPLFSEKLEIPVQYTSEFRGRFSLLISGSAGEGVQSAAETFAQAAISAGLHVTKKGNYPVTVGIGFSSAEIIISDSPIHYTGIQNPDMVIITSKDGLEHIRPRINKMTSGKVWIEQSLEKPHIAAEIVTKDFLAKGGARNAAVYSLFLLLQQYPIFPIEALANIFDQTKASAKMKSAEYLA